MKPYLYPAVIVGIVAGFLCCSYAGLLLGAVVFTYGRHEYQRDMILDRKLLEDIRAIKLTPYR